MKPGYWLEPCTSHIVRLRSLDEASQVLLAGVQTLFLDIPKQLNVNLYLKTKENLFCMYS